MFKPLDPQQKPAALEEAVLAFWQKEKIFEKSQEQNKGKDTYVIYDGPATANTRPPLHTIVPMSFKDLVGRYKTMRGYYAHRQVGWDTHGLPVEVQIEKTLGLTSKKDILNLVPGDERASIQAFNKACRESVFEFIKDWHQFVPRVGYWTDTENPYITFDPKYVEGVWSVFRRVWDKGLVYKDYKVLPYCPRCGTALSAAEVAQEYQDVKDVSIFVAFPLIDNPKQAFLAWTTTPWTMPGNVGLAVGADLEYVVVEQKDEAGETHEYILAKSRLEILKGDYVIIEELKGSELEGIKYQAPYGEIFQDSPEPKHQVVVADFVTTEDGTGIVHTAVMYGEEDFNLGKKVGFPMQHTVGLDGLYLANVPEFAGMYVREALVPILKSLQEKGVLYAKQTINHSYPHCWRCKTPLMYYAKDSWFIAMSKLRSELVASNSKVNWVPEHIKEGRFGDFIREARDWAVSRERFWGSPMPIWTNEKGEYICISSFEELKQYAKDPELVGKDFDPHRPFIDDIILVKDGQEYRREPVVLDVWFDSGAMPFASGREALGEFPADYVAEAIDQTRGWFNSLNNISTILASRAPFETVVCMGHLVDEHGKKMSKSGPNAVVPAPVFEAIGVDAIRWFLYTVNSPGEAKAFSLTEAQTAYRKSVALITNMVNYFVTYANLEKFIPGSENPDSLTLLDKWVMSREVQVIEEVTANLEAYDFMRASRALEEYIDELSTWYLRRSRKRTDTAFFATFYSALRTLLVLMAPFTPFSAEHLYSSLRQEGEKESIHLLSWPVATRKADTQVLQDMATVRQIVELGLSLRSELKQKVRQPLARAQIILSQQGAALSEEALQIIADELNVIDVQLTSSLDEGLPFRTGSTVQLALDPTMNDQLLELGQARELLRQLQNARKRLGLQPGQLGTIQTDQYSRATIEPLLVKYSFILEDAFLRVDPEKSWQTAGIEEVKLGEESIFLSIVT